MMESRVDYRFAILAGLCSFVIFFSGGCREKTEEPSFPIRTMSTSPHGQPKGSLDGSGSTPSPTGSTPASSTSRESRSSDN